VVGSEGGLWERKQTDRRLFTKDLFWRLSSTKHKLGRVSERGGGEMVWGYKLECFVNNCERGRR
jgi:hypothetical protein